MIIEFQQLADNSYSKIEDYEKLAELIYETDPYIYPAMFQNKEDAIKILAATIKRGDDNLFKKENIFVAKKKEK